MDMLMLYLKQINTLNKVACEMEIPISNYYLYRDGRGNPTGKTIDKILEVIYVDYPEIIDSLLVFQLEQLRTKSGFFTATGL